MASKNNKEVKYKSSEICSVSCLKGFMIAFNFLFFVMGLGVLALSVWTNVSKMQFVALLGSSLYNVIVIFLIASGLLVLVTGILGCIGALRKNASLLLWFSILVAFVFLLELLAGVLAFVYHESIHNELSDTMLTNLNKNYNQTDQGALTKAVDEMQQDFHCCGVVAYSDWLNSTYIKNNPQNLGLKTPTSCCKTPSFDCSTRDHPSNIYRVLGSESMGCLIKLELYIQEHVFVLAVAGISVACFELFVLLLGISFRRKIQIENNKPY